MAGRRTLEGATPSGTVSAEKLVLATNGYTDNGARPALHAVPVYSGIVASEPLPDEVARDVFPVRASLYELARSRCTIGRCVQPSPDGRAVPAEPRRIAGPDAVPDALYASPVAAVAPVQVHPWLERPARGHHGSLSRTSTSRPTACWCASATTDVVAHESTAMGPRTRAAPWAARHRRSTCRSPI